MEVQQEETTRNVQQLIEALQENQQFYRTAANNAISSQLRGVFHQRAEQRGDFAKALAVYTDEMIVEEEADKGDLLDSLHRGLVTIKAAMTIEQDKTDNILIQESLEAEQQLLDAYKEILAETDNLPSGIASEVHSQYATIKTGYTYIGTALNAPETVVLGLFFEINDTQRIIEELSAKGVSKENIHVVAQEEVVSKALDDNRATMAKEGAGTGALSGSVFGGLLGLIIGASMVLTMGPVAIIGIPALAGTTAAGTAIGALYGSLFGALLGWGVAEDEVHGYIKGIREGQILVAATVEPSMAEETAALFKQHHGDFVSVRHQSFDE